MARAITPKDCHTLINSLVKQITGQQSITAIDTSSFVSAGELVMSYGMENVYNAINALIAKTIIASRPYDAKLSIIQEENNTEFASRIRKISYYSKDSLPSGNFNTDLYTNFASGYTSGDNSGTSTKSQWEQNPCIPLEMTFSGLSVLQDCVTLYEDAVKWAFTSEAEFAKFVAGYINEHENDIQSQKEAFNRMCVLSKIGQVYDMSSVMTGSVINLTSAFNTAYGTSYTSDQLRKNHLQDFLKFFVATFKNASRFMTNRSAKNHWAVPKTIGADTYSILRHTPYADQRVILFAPLFTDAKANVYSEIFHPDYLDLGAKYEEVDFWQSEASGASISITPAVVNTTTGVQEAGTAVALDYVVGMIFDRDALFTNYNLETVRTTNVEARKGYRNTWLSIGRGYCVDPTENCIIFTMED